MTVRLGAACGMVFGLAAVGFGQTTSVDLEVGAVYQTRNTAAIPADSTKFSYRDLLGRGPYGYQRLTAIFNPNENSGYRFVWAPLTLSGTGQLETPVNFDGDVFAPGVSTEGHYTFNNYRFTWWHRWKPIWGSQVRAGWTLFLRDARVSLYQTGKYGTFYNLGPVPLFYLDAEHPFTDRLSATFEFDGLVAPQGGALDFGLALNYRVSASATVKAQLRYLDGGTGSGSAYSYATLNYIALGLRMSW